jgi:hypothetical protein
MTTSAQPITRDDVMRETLAHVRRVGNLMLDVVERLQRAAMRHDDSKFSAAEFDTFAAETPGLRSLTYGSAEYKAALDRLGPALQHHYQANSHHPEHFGLHICAQCGSDDRTEPCTCGGPRTADMSRMDLLQLIELLADWKAATERHADGSLPRSIVGNAKRFGYDDRFACLLARTAANLGWISEVEYQGMEIVKAQGTSRA